MLQQRFATAKATPLIMRAIIIVSALTCLMPAASLRIKQQATVALSTDPAENVVEQANALFDSEEQGVMVRMPDAYGPIPWTVHGEHHKTKFRAGKLSFGIVNKFAWSSKLNKTTLYTRFDSQGILAHPEAIKFVKCAYPCDGWTTKRTACALKCKGKFTSEGPGKVCAYDANEIPEMLKAYALIKADKSPWAKGVCDKWAEHANAWTELVMTEEEWETSLPKYVWAYLVIDECDDACRSRAKQHLKDFKEKYDIELPVLGMSLTKQTSPFYLRTDITLDNVVSLKTQIGQLQNDEETASKLSYLSYIYHEEVTDEKMFDSLDFVYRNPKILSSKLISCRHMFEMAGPFQKISDAPKWQQLYCSMEHPILNITEWDYATTNNKMTEWNAWLAPTPQLARAKTAYADNAWVEVHRKMALGAHGMHEGGNKMADGTMAPYGCWFLPMRGTGVFVNIGKTLVLKTKPKNHVRKVVDGHLADSMCPTALAQGYDSVQYLSGWKDKFELVMCTGQCAREPFFATCPQGLEFRTGLKADKECACDNKLPVLNCGDERVLGIDFCAADFTCGK